MSEVFHVVSYAVICFARESGLPVSNGCWQKLVVENILQNTGIL